MFETVVLAGGLGTRLKSVTGDMPKPMVDVAGQPFLYRLMRELEKQGCAKIVLSLGYKAEYITERVALDRPVACEVFFSVESEPLGTGGAIKKAARQITSDRFLVLNGDSYADIDLNAFMAKSESVDLLISGVQVSDVSRYGVLDLDRNCSVRRFLEKGGQGPGVINSGTYVVKRNDILSHHQEKFSFEVDFVRDYSGRLFASVSEGYFIDIGIPDDYHRACDYFS